MRFVVDVPHGFDAERRYILSVILGEFLGLEYDVVTRPNLDCVVLRGDRRRLSVSNVLLAGSDSNWPELGSMPSSPLATWDMEELGRLGCPILEPIPVICGSGLTSGGMVSISETEIELGLDVFGAAFFMLSRMEEAVNPTRDPHGRFPMAEALASREGFSNRPIIDEYVEVLWACIRYLWPRAQRTARSFTVWSTHDVDKPFEFAYCGALGLAPVMVRDLVRGRSVRQAARHARAWANVRRRGIDRDPANTFEWIMTTAERHGVGCSFYFQPSMDPMGRSSRRNIYNVRDPEIQHILSHIDERGHEVGIHPSYSSHLKPARLQHELDVLRSACDLANLRQRPIGGRQHYLRWDVHGSLRAWEAARLEYDSSLGYAEAPGFRCGVARTFRAYDVVRRRALRVRERPLILMDVSLDARNKMGLDLNKSGELDQALELISGLKRRVKLIGGEFTVLWHNNKLASQPHQILYEAAITSSGN